MSLQCLCTGFSQLPLTHDPVPDPSIGNHLNDINPLYAAPVQSYYAACWEGTNPQIGQGEIADHSRADYGPPLQPQDSQGPSGPPDPPGPPFTTIVDALSSELEPPSRVKDDYFCAISSSGQVEGPTESVAIQVQNSTTQEASFRREQKVQVKKEKDKERKRRERSKDERAYTRICQLLDIKLRPRSTLADRSECFGLCIHPYWGY